MDKVSIIIPVYKDGTVDEIVEILQQDPYPYKEFIIVATLPTFSLRKKLNKISKYKNVKIIINEQRKGKVDEVNEATKIAEGNIFIFFDSDIIPLSFNIEEVVILSKRYDLIDFVKIFNPKNMIGKLAHVEFFGYFLLQRTASKIGKSILLNGAGFAVRRDVWEKLGGYRKVIIEDMDFATRLYIMGGTYHLLESVILLDEPPPNWKKWIDQRKRWAYGGVEWFFNYPKEILGYIIKYPSFLLTYITYYNPAVLLYMLLSLLPNSFWYNLAFSVLIVLATKMTPLIFFIVSAATLVSILRAFLFLTAVIVVFIILYEVMYIKFYRRSLNPLWILGFLLFYSPLFLLIILIMFIHYLIFEKPPNMDWKV